MERKTLAAAIEDVAYSVESHRYGRAASAVFTDLLLVVGIEARIFGSPRGRAAELGAGGSAAGDT